MGVSDVELLEMLGQLESSEDDQRAALSCLALQTEWKRDHITGLRLGGHLGTLIQLLEGATPSRTLEDTLIVLLKAAEQDTACKDALIKGGAIRRLCKFLDASCPYHDTPVVLLSVRLLYQCINSGEIARAPAVDELFKFGAASKAARFLEGEDASLAQSTGSLFWEIADIPTFRERCRDLGIIPVVLKLLTQNPDVPGYMGFINNLARSEALHLTLQELGVIDVLDTVLCKTTLEVNRTQALITVAHVYAGQEKHAHSEELLSKYDASLSVTTMLDSCLRGDSMFGGAWWALEEVVQAIQSLSQKQQHAEMLYKVGCVDLLIEVLTRRSEDSDSVYQACRAVANMTSAPSLKGRMQQNKDLIKATQLHEASEDMRVQDAAKGALLQLGALKDLAVIAADSALNGDSRDYHQKYVFLSHKRTDSKDFARALYNLLVVRKIKTFLDYEYREELSDLGTIVANSTNIIFIMTDNIFDSPWCMKELEAAVDASINIILLVKEGSRWKNSEGIKVCEFPGDNILGNLPERVRKVFSRKALYHSDEYYQTFVEMLVKKILMPTPSTEGLPGGISNMPAASDRAAEQTGAQPQLLQPPSMTQQQQQPLPSLYPPQLPQLQQPQQYFHLQQPQQYSQLQQPQQYSQLQPPQPYPQLQQPQQQYSQLQQPQQYSQLRQPQQYSQLQQPQQQYSQLQQPQQYSQLQQPQQYSQQLQQPQQQYSQLQQPQQYSQLQEPQQYSQLQQPQQYSQQLQQPQQIFMQPLLTDQNQELMSHLMIQRQAAAVRGGTNSFSATIQQVLPQLQLQAHNVPYGSSAGIGLRLDMDQHLLHLRRDVYQQLSEELHSSRVAANESAAATTGARLIGRVAGGGRASSSFTSGGGVGVEPLRHHFVQQKEHGLVDQLLPATGCDSGGNIIGARALELPNQLHSIAGQLQRLSVTATATDPSPSSRQVFSPVSSSFERHLEGASRSLTSLHGAAHADGDRERLRLGPRKQQTGHQRLPATIYSVGTAASGAGMTRGNRSSVAATGQSPSLPSINSR